MGRAPGVFCRESVALQQALDEHGCPGATSAFHGCEMELLSVDLVCSHAHEVWSRGCYAAQDIPTLPATYLHHDQDWHQIKAVLYLTPPRARAAPSLYQGWASLSPGQSRLRTFTFTCSTPWTEPQRTLGWWPHYYRRGFTDAGLRARFVA